MRTAASRETAARKRLSGAHATASIPSGYRRSPPRYTCEGSPSTAPSSPTAHTHTMPF